LNLTEPPTSDFDILKLPSIVRAQALEKQAKAKSARLRASPRGSITEEEMQQADTDVEVARANIRQAELEARTTVASVRHRQAALKTAQQRLADTKIIVPAPNPPSDPGVPPATEYLIAFRKIAVGETVRIIPPSTLRRSFDSSSIAAQIATHASRTSSRRGRRTISRTGREAYPREPFTGTVSRVNRSVERSSPHVQRRSRGAERGSASERQLRRAAGCGRHR
jgi:hypothetical protein